MLCQGQERYRDADDSSQLLGEGESASFAQSTRRVSAMPSLESRRVGANTELSHLATS